MARLRDLRYAVLHRPHREMHFSHTGVHVHRPRVARLLASTQVPPEGALAYDVVALGQVKVPEILKRDCVRHAFKCSGRVQRVPPLQVIVPHFYLRRVPGWPLDGDAEDVRLWQGVEGRLEFCIGSSRRPRLPCQNKIEDQQHYDHDDAQYYKDNNRHGGSS